MEAVEQDGIRLRSALPGRERWEVDAIRGRPQRVAHLERVLATHRAIVSAKANPVTGRLLVLYDHEANGDGVALEVRGAVAAAIAACEPPEAPAEPAPEESGGLDGPAVATAVAVGGGAVFAAAVSFGASVFSAAALVGIGALSAVALVSGIKRQRELLAPSLAAPGRSRPHPLPALLEYARPYRAQIALASTFSVLKKIFDIAPPILIGLAISMVSTQGSALMTGLGITTLPLQLLALGGLTAVVFAGESLFDFLQRSMWRRIAQLVQRDLRLDAYTKAQDLALAHFDDESIAEVAIPLTEQINQIELFVNEGVDELLQIGTNMVLLVAIFMVVAPNLAWIAALPVPLLIWRTFRYQTAIAPLYADVETKAGQLNKQILSNIMGLPTIRSFCTEEHEKERIKRLSQEYLDSNQPAIREFASFIPTFRLPVLAAFAGILIVGGASVGMGTLAIGQYALVLFLVQRFLFPFAYLGNILDGYQRTMAAIDRVFDLFHLPVGPAGGDRRLPAAAVRGEIVFDRVSFTYPSGVNVLHDFSLNVPAGQTVALVGVTGVGKSTIVKILLRLYEFEAGRVSVDGHDIRTLELRDLRGAISWVSQDLFLFDGTVFDNIVYGTFEATAEEVLAASRVAEAHRFVVELPQGYDTRIGERGNKLSTGQRQRLCLARALLKLTRAPILVLDEATSSVDTETESAVQRSLEQVSRGRTTIIIAHRLSTVRNADRIFVLGPGGRIVEQGRHEELLRQGGFYTRLWRVQSDEEALDLEARAAS